MRLELRFHIVIADETESVAIGHAVLEILRHTKSESNSSPVGKGSAYLLEPNPPPRVGPIQPTPKEALVEKGGTYMSSYELTPAPLAMR